MKKLSVIIDKLSQCPQEGLAEAYRTLINTPFWNNS